jgi:hypothetical protein
MGKTARFQETLRRLAMIDEGQSPGWAGSSAPPPRSRSRSGMTPEPHHKSQTINSGCEGVLMTQVEADASAEGTRADRRRLVQLIVAAVLMGVTGVMLVATGVWAPTFKGLVWQERGLSFAAACRKLRRAS